MGVEQYYQQSRDKRWSKWSVTDGGACFGLSLFWLEHKARGGLESQSFWTWLGVKPNAVDPNNQGYTADAMSFLSDNNGVLRVMGQQDKARQAANSSSTHISTMLTGMLKAFMETNTPAKMRGDTLRQQAPSRTRVLNAMTRYYYGATGGMFLELVALTFGANKGHAIACAYEPRGPIWMFDPNAGEVSWNKYGAVADFVKVDSNAHRCLDLYAPLKDTSIWVFS